MANSGHSGIDPANKELDRYEIIKDMFKTGIVRKKDIKEKLDMCDSSIETAIDNLSHEIPIWEPGFGLYKLLDDRDIENYRQELRNGKG